MKDTSLQAHQTSFKFKEIHHSIILAVLARSNCNLTYKEIAKIIGWSDPNKVSRRMPELVGEGKVEIDEKRKCTIAKSNCSAYVLTQ